MRVSFMVKLQRAKEASFYKKIFLKRKSTKAIEGLEFLKTGFLAIDKWRFTKPRPPQRNYPAIKVHCFKVTGLHSNIDKKK